MVSPTAFSESALLTNAAAMLFTAAQATEAVVKKCTATNTDASNGYFVTVYIIPSGQTTGAAYLIINARAIGAGQTLDITEMVNQILKPGDFIEAFADTGAKVSMRVSGYLVSGGN